MNFEFSSKYVRNLTLMKNIEEENKVAMEARASDSNNSGGRRIDDALETFEVRDKYYNRIAQLIPKTETILFRYIEQFLDKNREALFTSHPSKSVGFNQETDEGIVFKCCNIDKDEMKRDLLKVIVMDESGNELVDLSKKENYRPFTVCMVYLIRYYTLKKDDKKLKLLYYYLGFSLFIRVLHRTIRSEIREEIMDYTINNLPNRMNYRKLGSIDALVLYAMQDALENTYKKDLLVCADQKLYYIIDALRTRIANPWKAVFTAYNNNCKNRKVIFKSDPFYGDSDEIRIDKSVVSEIDTLSQSLTTKFFSEAPNTTRIKMSSEMEHNINTNELKIVIDSLRTDDMIKTVQSFYANMFYAYITLVDGATISSIHTSKFIASMNTVHKKGNSKNRSIQFINATINQWLERGSNLYRTTRRTGTQNDLRNAIFDYFLLSVLK